MNWPGQEEIVIKTISGVDSEGVRNTLERTITGDGKVVLILDLAVMARRIFTFQGSQKSLTSTKGCLREEIGHYAIYPVFLMNGNEYTIPY